MIAKGKEAPIPTIGLMNPKNRGEDARAKALDKRPSGRLETWISMVHVSGARFPPEETDGASTFFKRQQAEGIVFQVLPHLQRGVASAR